MLPLVMPLALDLSKKVLEFLGEGQGVAGSFTAVGAGIGGIMLLIVLIYYLISLLDGGKFQLKMLWPFAIYLFVCNFSWISTPTVSFITAINEGLANSTQAKVNNLYAPQTNMATKFFAMAKEDVSSKLYNKDDAQDISDFMAKKRGTKDIDSGQGTPGTGDSNASVTTVDEEKQEAQKGLLANIGNYISSALEKFWNYIKVRFVTNIVGPTQAYYTSLKYSFVGILALILNFICDAMAFVIQAFAAVLSGIVIAFGPITFAFAILPGMHRNLGSWFIRLVQFSLWSPIVNLIKYFCASLFMGILGGGGTPLNSLFLVAMIIAELVALVSVPTIASMIVEGASGGVALSQGLHTIASAATGGTIGGWISGAITKRQTNMLNEKEAARDEKEMTILQGISDKMGGSGFAGGGIQGQNPMKDARGGYDGGGSSSGSADGQNSFDNSNDSEYYG